MSNAIKLVYVLFTQIGVGSIFGPVNTADKLADAKANTLACSRSEFKKSDTIVAHSFLSCGTPVQVCVQRTGKCAQATVGDRAYSHNDIDISLGLAKKLGLGKKSGLNRKENITLQVIYVAKTDNDGPLVTGEKLKSSFLKNVYKNLFDSKICMAEKDREECEQGVVTTMTRDITNAVRH